MRVKVGSKYWDLVFERNPYSGGIMCDGYCDPPDKPHKRIVIRNSLRKNPEKLLDTILHELTHAQGWCLDEDFVSRSAEDAARIVIKLGFTYKDPQ